MKQDAPYRQLNDEEVLRRYIFRLEENQKLNPEIPKIVSERIDGVHKATNDAFYIILTILEACQNRKWLQEDTLLLWTHFRENYTSDLTAKKETKIPNAADVEIMDKIVEAALSDLRMLFQTLEEAPRVSQREKSPVKG